MAVDGSRAYVVDYFEGLRVLDISNPAVPVEIGSLEPLSIVNDVAVSGTYAYVTDTYDGLIVIDISDPTNPVQVGGCDTPGMLMRLAIVGNYAFLGDYYTFQVADISDPTAPVLIGSYDPPGNASSDVTDLFVSGDFAYVADGLEGLCIVSIATPSAPTEAGFLVAPGAATEVTVENGIALVTEGWGGLRLFDVANPDSPTETDCYDPLDRVNHAAADGNYAYVSNAYNGLRIVDISNPAAPVEVAFYDSPYAWQSAVSNGRAYVASGEGGMRILDVSNPFAPSELGYFHPGFPNSIVRVEVQGTYAYALNGEYPWLYIVDVGNPAAPAEVATWTFQDGYPNSLAVAGAYAYAVDVGGLRIINISNPHEPVLAGECDISGYPHGIRVDGDFAFIAAGNAGLRVLNIADAANPVEVGFYDTPGYANGVAVSGTLALVGDEFFFGVYDCSAAMSASDPFILPPSSFSLSCYPNPFNATTQIRFDLPRAGFVKLEVYDVTGRRVETLASRVFEAGTHSLAFDGSDRASGMYVVRMSDGDRLHAQKVMLLK